VHLCDESFEKEKVIQDVENEYQKGFEFLSISDQHWGASSLSDIKLRPISYLQGWLRMIQVLRRRDQTQHSERVNTT